MNQLFTWLTSNWELLINYGGTAAAVSGWLAERNKRLRDNRDSDVQFWKQTIEAQNDQIEKLRAQVLAMEAKYDTNNQAQLQRIKELTDQVDELSEKLEKYEPERKRTKHTLRNA